MFGSLALAGAQESPLGDATLEDPDAQAAVKPAPERPAAPTPEEAQRARQRRPGEVSGVELGLYLGVHGFSIDTTLGRIALADPLTGELQSINTTPTTSVPLGVRLGFRFAPRIALEFEAEAMAVSTRDQEGSGVVFGYRAHLNYRLAGGASQFRPFVIAGLGAHTSILSRSLATDTDTALAGTIGGGLELAFNPRWAMRLDARALIGPGADDARAAADVEILIGFCYSASGACGWEARGAIDGAINDGGPPQRDSDDDGIFGDTDRCPITPEDKDGVDDEDGCPEADTDGDGIQDPDDRCVNAAENDNGWEDDDGCPEELPDALASFEGTVETVGFRGATSVFASGAFDALDGLVAGLNQFTTMRMRILVHTSKSGDADADQKLSEDRAQVIRQYLIDKGIYPGRVEVLGVGSSTPLDEGDDSAAARKRNARVEMHFVTPG